MNKNTIIRLAVLTVILIIFSYFSVGYTYEIFISGLKKMRELHIDTDSINDINIDGSDFTLFFRLMGAGTNALLGFLELFFYCLYAVIILIVSLIFSIPFKHIALKKVEIISEEEKTITKRIFIGFIVISILTGLFLTHFTVIIPLLTYTAIWAATILFVYIIPLTEFRER